MTDLNKLDVPDLVLLFQLTPISNQKIYFTNNPSGVVYGNIPYLSISCDIDDIKINSQGEFGNSIFNISDQDYLVSTLIDNSDNNLEKSKLEIYLTRKTYLDNGETPDPTAFRLLQIYYVEQIQELRYGESVKIALSNFNWMEKHVGRPISSRCTVEYRGQYCRYAGRFYDINNNPTDDAEKDDCDGSLNACNIRHNYGLLPFKGFLINR
jgi:lambda family phage minor tail protein L